jgi:PAS domain S-box-containing protein
MNVSPLQLRDRSLSSQIRSIAERRGFPLRQLMIEIIETALVDNLELAIDTANDIKALGSRLALDDFGTGYSSLRHLNFLPFDEIKIDKSFVLSMCDQRESRKIAAAVVGMGQSLSLTTVAEGVEDKNHADMLFYLGCELGQGWHYGRPVPATDLPALIERNVLGPSTGSPLVAADMATHLEAFPMERLAQLQAIYDGAPVGLSLLDGNLRYLSHNKRLSEMSALSAGPRLGKTVEEVAPIFYLQMEPYLKRALEGEAISNLEVLVEGPGSPSEFNTLLLSLQPVRDAANEVIGISMAAMDITVLKRMERTLHEHEDHYRRTLELSAINLSLHR